MIIYKATNLINGKIYIGQTTNPLWYRVSQHIRETNSSKRKNTYFHNAIQKYGKENFVFEQIDSAEDMETLNELEKYWIIFYESNKKENGYNLDSGGLNCKKSQETKNKIGKIKKEHWQNEELKQKMKIGLEKATKIWVESCRRETKTILCLNCNTSITLPSWEAKNRKFCSAKCANDYNYESRLRGSELGVIKLTEIRNKKWEDTKESVLEWTKQNKELVLSCPFNKISTVLIGVLAFTQLSDMRMVAKATVGNYNKKELLRYLQEYLSNCDENIC